MRNDSNPITGFRRFGVGMLSLAFVLGAAACSDEDGDGESTDEEVEQIEDGVDAVTDEVEQQIDEGAEEEGEE